VHLKSYLLHGALQVSILLQELYKPFPCRTDTGIIDTRQPADLRLLEPGIAIEEFTGRTDRRPQTGDGAGLKKSEASFIGYQRNQIDEMDQIGQRNQRIGVGAL
jgi:hypothetical protein